MCTILFFSSRRRHTRCALVTEFRRVLFRSAGGRALIEDPGCPVMRKGLNLAGVEAVPASVTADGMQVDLGIRIAPDAAPAIVAPAQQLSGGAALSPERRAALHCWADDVNKRSDEHTSELQTLLLLSHAASCSTQKP